MTVLVISQPMLFPWVGMFEQIRLADIFVYYVDVQFSKGSFVNRVQIKTSSGIKWLTVPLLGVRLGQKIKEVEVNYQKDWRHRHFEFLRQTYKAAPYKHDVMDLVSTVYAEKHPTIDALSRKSMDVVIDYFGLNHDLQSYLSSSLNLKGKSSQRVLDVVKHFQADEYVTGHGASNYLDHEIFEQNGVKVAYMNYLKKAYLQDFGEFTPYVSILDLIAHCGVEGVNNICSNAIYWKDFFNGPYRDL